MTTNWPVYALVNGWLVDEDQRICPHQLEQFAKSTTSNDAEKWLAKHDIRGSVLGSSFHLPQSRVYARKQ